MSIQSLLNTNRATFLMTSHVRSALWTLPQVDLFWFVFWINLKTPKIHFEINWPLLYLDSLFSCNGWWLSCDATKVWKTSCLEAIEATVEAVIEAPFEAALEAAFVDSSMPVPLSVLFWDVKLGIVDMVDESPSMKKKRKFFVSNSNQLWCPFLKSFHL